MRKRTGFAALAAAFALAGCSRTPAPSSAQANQTQTAGESASAPANQQPLQTNEGPSIRDSYANLVAKVSPAVVTITAEHRAHPAHQFPFFNDPFLQRFFGGPRAPQEQEPVEVGLGSGVITQADGHLLTNDHVVDGADKIMVQLQDRRIFQAKLVGADPPSDLAVLKIDASGLPVLPLGNSDKVRVGDRVLALGNPMGLGQTVTNGIISAKGRATGISNGSFEDFLQTDAPINRGNSGGALVDMSAQLIGINSQILSTSGGSMGIGFAIPSNMAKNVMQQLISTGTVRRGELGIAVQPVNSDIAKQDGLKNTSGVYIAAVEPGGPADKAGVRKGDVVLAINGAPVNDPNELRNRVAGTQPGTEVTLTLMRGGQQKQVRAQLGQLKVPKQEG